VPSLPIFALDAANVELQQRKEEPGQALFEGLAGKGNAPTLPRDYLKMALTRSACVPTTKEPGYRMSGR